jgi:exopolysaccharide production protein ExoQ
MTISNSPWRLAAAHNTQNVYAPTGFYFRKALTCVDTPVSQQVISWLLFWPILSLIARQAVYFSGPAVTSGAFQNGAAMGGARGSHLLLYVNLLSLLGFVLAGYKQVLTALRKNPLIPAMLTLAVCSALWSVSAQITLQMSVGAGLCTLFACYLSARYTAERLMQLLIFMGVASGVLSIFFALALPAYGLFQGYGGGAWQGICDHKNTLGISMAFLLTPVFFTDAYGRGRKLIYSVMLIFLIYKSQSRSAWFDTVGLLLFIGWLSLVRRVRARELPPILLITATIGVAAILAGVHFWPMLTTSVGKDPTMTGRQGIYIEVWRSILKHPVLGYGFGAFWYGGNFESQRISLAVRWPNIGYAENGLMELALQSGLLGVGLLLAMIARTIARGIFLLRSRHYSPTVAWYLTILFLAALTNIDAGWFMTLNTLDWVLILVSCIGMNQEMRRAVTASD